MTDPDIVSPVALQRTNEATCTLPWYVQKSEYPPALATYQPLVNGEEAFKAVHLAIEKATKTVDIICWGFQPSMYFIRDGKNEVCIGDLLRAKARKGVRVRVLGWEMPFNLAGFAGEANLPGKGNVRFKDRELQHSTPEQYALDREWFADCAVADDKALLQATHNVPVFVSRGFSWAERAEIAKQVKSNSLDPQISTRMHQTLKLSATHHQKSVLIDYECVDTAVGFVMGHNMLDEYWDTDAHSALNRKEGSKPAPNAGPRADTPRQDISSQISGPILEHLHHNFASAWLKETGEDLLHTRQAKLIGPQLQCTPGANVQIAQLLRTQAQEGIRDIEKLYLKAVNNATQFIYIENQYFRWPPLAEAIKKAAVSQTRAGRDPGLHGALHVFVITNATNDGIGAGTVNTQRMLESLGRAETIPEMTKLQRVQALRAAAKPQYDPRDRTAQIALEQEIEAVMKSVLTAQDYPGLKVHLCSLVAPDSPPGQTWMPVYIHSKLMIVNDVFTTHGSANINTRSMQVDSELNIAHEWANVTQALRRRLWEQHTGGMGGQDDPRVAFDKWREIINENQNLREDKKNPYAPLVEFYYGDANLSDFD